MPSTLLSTPDELITYDEAAELIGIKRTSTLQLAKRGHLHPVEDPADRRRRLVSRREVETYAATRSLPFAPHRAQVRREGTPPIMPSPSAESSKETLTMDMQTIAALGAAIALVGIFLLAFKSAGSVTDRVLIIGTLAALALFICGKLYEQGRLGEKERRQLEHLARTAEADPEPFVTELEGILSRIQAVSA